MTSFPGFPSLSQPQWRRCFRNLQGAACWYSFITQTHCDFLWNRSHKWKTSVYIDKTCKHKHKHPTRPPTLHAVSGFHVLFMPKLLIGPSNQAQGAGFLAVSKYFKRSTFMLEIRALRGRYFVSQVHS